MTKYISKCCSAEPELIDCPEFEENHWCVVCKGEKIEVCSQCGKQSEFKEEE